MNKLTHKETKEMLKARAKPTNKYEEAIEKAIYNCFMIYTGYLEEELLNGNDKKGEK